MALSTRSKLRNVTLVGAVGLSLTLAACGGSDAGSDDAAGTAASGGDCAAYTQYGDLKGKTVSIYTSVVTPEDTPYIESFKPFEKCTGVKIDYQGDKQFETQILVRAKAGNPPDLAWVPQPGLLKQLVDTGAVKAAPKGVEANVDKWYGKDWKAYGTVDGKFYAAPNSANVKSLVWYSPSEFEEKGYKIPTTLDELKTLSDTIAKGGTKPWCAGIGSGEATGWPVTDWMEDFMLRLYGPDVYDQWVSHKIPFNGPESTAALDAAGAYLKNPAYVNGGLGEVKSIASTEFVDGGLPILEGTCSLHRQASFYANNWGEGVKVAQDGDVFAFYLPGKDAASKPVLGGGEFTTAFADRPEVQAFQTWLSSDAYSNIRAPLSPNGGWISANKGLDPNLTKNGIDKLSVTLLQDPATVFRFDGSDMMPAAIGSNAFWKQATSWITGQSTKDTVDKIEAAWPK
jgi:alpha-glucoside transport system substrate-binding protein